MVKKSSFIKKLASYSAMATVVVAANKKAGAQIVYTHIDTIICDGYSTLYGNYHLDLNNDDTVDFDIHVGFRKNVSFDSYRTMSYTAGADIIPYNSNAVANTKNNKNANLQLANLLNAGQEIGLKDTFDIFGGALLYNRGILGNPSHQPKEYYSGLWDTTEKDKFLGLSLTRQGKTYYGWARLTVSKPEPYLSSYCVTLNDYAVNLQSGSSIIAGDTTAGLAPVQQNHFSIYPNPTSGQLSIISNQLMINEITLTNVLGQIIYKSPSGDLGVSRVTFDIKDEGMYFVTVTCGNETTTQKVMVVK